MMTTPLDALDTEELIAVARWQLDQSQYADALITIKHLNNRQDSPAEGLRLGGKIYGQLGLYEKAKEAFRQYLEQVPSALMEQFQYGMVHYENRELENAIAIWKNILDQQPGFPPALFYTALAYANSGATEKAMQQLEALIASTPDDNMYYQRGQELIKSIQSNQQSTNIDNSGGDASQGLTEPTNKSRTLN